MEGCPPSKLELCPSKFGLTEAILALHERGWMGIMVVKVENLLRLRLASAEVKTCQRGYAFFL
jgi:hypothetical protein